MQIVFPNLDNMDLEDEETDVPDLLNNETLIEINV